MFRIHTKRLALLGWVCLCAGRMAFGQTPSARPAQVDLVAVNQAAPGQQRCIGAIAREGWIHAPAGLGNDVHTYWNQAEAQALSQVDPKRRLWTIVTRNGSLESAGKMVFGK